MRKFWAVTTREYKKIVFTWTFIVGTLLAPLIASLFIIVPTVIFSIKGDAQRLALVDQSGGKVASRFRDNLSPQRNSEESAGQTTSDSPGRINQSAEEEMRRTSQQLSGSFAFVEYDPAGKSPEQIRQELNARIKEKQIDAYLIIPPNFDSPDAGFEYYSRNPGDIVATSFIENALNKAVRSERLARANISEGQLKELSREVKLNRTKVSERGEEKDEGGALGAAFVIGFLIYITLTIYGQVIMGAIVEEKETRIAEILFSSAKPFELMMGKLTGVGLAGLTQLAIWLSSALAFLAFGISTFNSAGFPITMPNITPLTIISFLIFFFLGFFIYATIYALIGSVVTTAQEGGQFAFPPIMILLIGFYCLFPVTRDPNSTFSFWVSVMPFLAPIIMPVRVMTEAPPYWQIALAIILNVATIIGLVWVASRVYRVGMLMYGKRATIPEVWKWIRQS